MNTIAKNSRPAYDQLRNLDAKSWTKAYFTTTSKADNVENNMSECFNAWIISERYMPVLTMIQEITFKLVTRIKNKREKMLNSDQILCPKIKKKLDFYVTEARNWNATWDGAGTYAVKYGVRVVTVDLVNKTCACRVFQLTGIPCAHAIAAIHNSRQQAINFVSDYFKRDMYLRSYSQPLEAIKGEEFWEFETTDPLLPPDIPKKLRGRPKKLR
ncbi:uncharacterized protein LOC141667699 [Apium graveolens]|uniref:uncharacterized protein LOC141667699 n=1 Tax=Apium graveolens TaxID=4045 RepID=UPI003D7B0A6F